MFPIVKFAGTSLFTMRNGEWCALLQWKKVKRPSVFFLPLFVMSALTVSKEYTVPAPFLAAFTIVLRHVFEMCSIQKRVVFKSAYYY